MSLDCDTQKELVLFKIFISQPFWLLLLGLSDAVFSIFEPSNEIYSPIKNIMSAVIKNLNHQQ